MIESSPRYNLTQTDLIKVAKGAGIAGAGAALTYLITWATSTDFGQWTPIIVAVASVLANMARKYLEDNR